MTETLSIEDEIRETLKGLKDTTEEVVEAAEEPIDDLKEDPTDIEETPTEAPEGEEVVIDEVKEEVEPAPQGLSAKMKEKWKDLDPEVRQELARREEDFHKKLTASDSEYHFGKKMKDVVSPYMAIIQSEGGTPESAVKDLLNTAYVLRTGRPEQKAQLLMQVAQQYGVDLSQAMQPQEQVHPALAEMQRELAMLRQQANPETIKQQLQEQMESDSITSQVNAFAGDPANKYFEQVKPIMASLLSSGAAQDIQEAYDRACYADPTIRSTLLAEQNKANDAKRKADVQRKKQASASVVGSPDGTSPNAKAPNKSLEDELREAMNASSGLI
jgi:predicted CopG family antitoxin